MTDRLRHATLQVKIMVVSMLTSMGAVCVTFGPIVAYELVTAQRAGTHSLAEAATLLTVVLVLSGGMAYLLARHFQCIISEPILRLAEIASHVSTLKDYSIRATKVGDDEVGVLVDRFNEMLVQIQTVNTELEHTRNEALTASDLKSQFVANMSHELRTPINGIFGLLALLLDTPLNDEQREYINTTKQSGQVLLQIVNDVLDLSKIEAGKLEIEPTMFELRPLLAQAIQPVQLKAAEKALPIEILCDANVPAIVYGDPARVRQIVLNLVHNAVKFTHEGGVRVNVIAGAAHDGQLRFEVTDTGVGIPERKLSGIFDKFTQADSSTTRRFGGSGLGLTISRQLAHLMGGHIGVDSREHEGSTFWFELPLLFPAVPNAFDGHEASESLERPQASEISLDGLRVLLAEDDETNQKVATYFLTKQGCHVDVAADGQFAVDFASRHRYHVILMDCQMPFIDGYEATRQIRALPGYRDVPIIAMTANAMAGDRQRCLTAGMNDYLSKPVLPEDIKAALARWWGESDPGTHSAAAKGVQKPDEPFDCVTLKRVFADDLPELRVLIALLKKDLPAYLAELQSRLSQRDLPRVAVLAHKIRGAAANAVAGPVCDVTKGLETAARAGDLARTTACAKQLNRAQTELLQALTAWLETETRRGDASALAGPHLLPDVVESSEAQAW